MTKAKQKEVKSKAGRHKVISEFSDEQIAEIEKMAYDGLTIEKIADYFEMGASTFHKYKSNDEKISRAYKKGRARSERHYSSNLRRDSDAGITSASIFALKTMQWNNEKKQYLAGISKEKTPIEIIDAAIEGLREGELTPQEANQVANLAITKANIVANHFGNDNLAIRRLSREELHEEIKLNEQLLAMHDKVNKQVRVKAV
jgi:hypothetical protein